MSDTSAAECSRVPAVLWLTWTLFIVYGSTIPFHFRSDRAFANLPRITWEGFAIPDVVQNLLLYVPFGFLGILALDAPRRSPSRRVSLVILSAAPLSAAVETLQLFTANRTASVADVVTNTMGALGGALATLMAVNMWRRCAARRWVAESIEVPAFYLFLMAMLVVCVSAWAPFDVILDVGTVWGKLKALNGRGWRFDAAPGQFLRYLFLTLAASFWLRQLGIRAAVTLSAIGSITVALGLEASKLLIESQIPHVQDAIVHASGAVTGAMISRGWPHGRSRRFWWALLGLTTWTAAAIYTRIVGTGSEAMSRAIEIGLMYFPMGFSFKQLFEGRREQWGAGVAAVLSATLIAAASNRYGQSWMLGLDRYTVDVVAGVLGLLLGTWASDSGWRLFKSIADRAGRGCRAQRSSIQTAHNAYE